MDRGILFDQPVQTFGDPFFVALLGGGHSHGHDGVRELDRREVDFHGAEAVVQSGLFKLGDGHDLAREGGVNDDALFALHDHEVAEAFLLSASLVLNFGAGRDLALIDAHEGDLSDGGVRHGLEDVSAGRSVRIGLELGVAHFLGALVGGAGQIVQYGVDDFLDACQAGGAGDENGAKEALGHAGLEGRGDFRVSQFAAEIFLHQSFVGLGDGFYEFRFHILEERGISSAGVGTEEGDDAFEIGFHADGDDYGAALAAEVFHERGQSFFKLRAFLVSLVDDEHAGQFVLVKDLDVLDGAHFHALGGVHDDDRAVGDRGVGDDLAYEIGVARHVAYEDVMPVGREVKVAAVNRNASFLLLGGAVGDGVLIKDRP